MPLARYFLADKGGAIHLAPTWDRGEPWTSSMRHITKGGRTFVISACQVLRMEHIPDHLDFKAEYLAGGNDVLNPGLSMIVDPDGRIVAGPTRRQGGNALRGCRAEPADRPRRQRNVAGHYSRPDVFQLRVEEDPAT